MIIRMITIVVRKYYGKVYWKELNKNKFKNKRQIKIKNLFQKQNKAKAYKNHKIWF